MSVLGMALEMLPHLKMQRLYAKAHGLFSPVPLQLKKDPTEAERKVLQLQGLATFL